MNILITGGTGFVGRVLCKKLAKEGHRLFVLTRNIKKYEGLLPFPCELVDWANLEEKLKSGQTQLEAVVHLAGESVMSQRWNDKVKKEIFNSRVGGTKKIVNLIMKYCPNLPTFISASAIGYYGDRGEESLEESSQKGRGFLSGVCESWETEAFKLNQTRTCVLRIGIVLGEGGGALKEMLPPFQNGIGGPLGNGQAWMSWIHIEDLVEMFYWCLKNKNASGIYNAVSPEPVRNNDFSEMLGKRFNKKLFFNTPEFALKLILGEASAVVLASQKIYPPKALKEGFQFQYIHTDIALKSTVENLKQFEKKIVFEQWIPKKTPEAFSFYENENNLEKITPPWLNFKVLRKSTERLQKGTLLDYQLKLYGLPLGWQTEIIDWQENKSFTDIMKKGPYKKWHHTHEFESLGDGTLVRDIIRYELHLGGVGKLTAGPLVDSDVQKIFGYRAQKIKEEFLSCPNSQN